MLDPFSPHATTFVSVVPAFVRRLDEDIVLNEIGVSGGTALKHQVQGFGAKASGFGVWGLEFGVLVALRSSIR